MKTKDIIRQIKEETNNVQIPNLSPQIIAKAPTEVVSAPPKKNYFRLKLSLISSFALFLVVAIIVITLNIQPSNPPYTISAPRKAYALQAISLVNVANQFQDSQTLHFKKSSFTGNHQNVAEEISYYLDFIQSLHNKEAIEYLFTDSDLKEYQYKIVTSIPFLEGKHTYTIYFNETAKVDDDDDVDEVSSTLLGIIIVGEEQFVISGEKEVEEDECEVNLVLYLSHDKNEYLKVSQEIEHLENEYSYEYYKNNTLKQEFSIESEDNGKSVNLEFTNGSGIEKSYEFLYQNDCILVEYEDDEEEIKAIITEDSEYYYIEFEDYSKIFQIKK